MGLASGSYGSETPMLDTSMATIDVFGGGCIPIAASISRFEGRMCAPIRHGIFLYL